MVQSLDALEKAGFAERRPHPTDRRKRAVHVTPKGEDVLRLEIFRKGPPGFRCKLCLSLGQANASPSQCARSLVTRHTPSSTAKRGRTAEGSPRLLQRYW